MCDKGNEVKINSKIFIVTKLDTDEIVLKDKRHNNVYKISIMSLPQSDHTCLSVVEDDSLLWHRRLGHASLSQLNKLVANDFVLGYLKLSSPLIRWVFRNKLDEQGNITRNTARLVVQGCNQEEINDYDDTFALVARMEFIRMLIAFAAPMEFTLY
uniref:Uncharacterized protein LOC104250124 n=1 Tax=Nicotiana sylvestris TaxID=4096 RepID=A0A1U7YPH6_NICSY|nr:PREDICTED: uncharacterized protein LOC104250124 [Nicotiana sylvestris]